MGATATRTGAGAPAGGLDWPRSILAALAALATAWTLSLLVAGAVLLVSGHLRVDVGDAAALPALIGFAATYCAVLAVLVGSHGGLHPVAAAAAGAVVVIVCLPGPNPLAAAAGLIAVAAIVEAGSRLTAHAALRAPAALGLGAAGVLVLAAGMAGVAASNQRGSPLPRARPPRLRRRVGTPLPRRPQRLRRLRLMARRLRGHALEPPVGDHRHGPRAGNGRAAPPARCRRRRPGRLAQHELRGRLAADAHRRRLGRDRPVGEPTVRLAEIRSVDGRLPPVVGTVALSARDEATDGA